MLLKITTFDNLATLVVTQSGGRCVLDWGIDVVHKQFRLSVTSGTHIKSWAGNYDSMQGACYDVLKYVEERTKFLKAKENVLGNST